MSEYLALPHGILGSGRDPAGTGDGRRLWLRLGAGIGIGWTVHLTLRQLQYLVAVVKAGSIAKAADHLHVTPTALSLQIKEIEDHFAVTLLTRHSRGVAATRLGEELCARATSILELVEEAERALAPSMQTRQLRLGTPPSIARLIGVDAMLGLDDWLGGVSVQVAEGWTIELEERLVRGELDIVVGYELQASEQVVVTDIVDDVFVFAAAPGLAGGEGPVSLAEVLRSDLVFYGEQSVSYRGARSAASAARLPMPAERQVNSINVWRSLLTRGLGTAIASVAAIDEEHRHGDLAIREIAGNPISSRIGVAVRAEMAGSAWATALTGFVSRLVVDGLARVGSQTVQSRVDG